jgi:hypothetical protein
MTNAAGLATVRVGADGKVAKDIEEAKYKLRKQYPDCEILEGHEEE